MPKNMSSGAMSCSAGFTLEFVFAPESVNRSRSQTISEASAPGSLYPVLQYCKGNSGEVSVSLYVYSNEGDDFIKHQKFFEACTPLENNNFAKTAPTVSMALGSGVIVRGILTSYNLNISKYTEDLKPKEYTYSVTLKELK